MQRRNDTATRDKALTYLLAGALGVLVVLSALGGILTVGDHLNAASPILGGAFYLAITVVCAVGVAYPIVQISRRPVFGLYQLHEGGERAQARHREMLVSNIEATGAVDEATRARLDQALAAKDSHAIAELFCATCGPLVDAHITAAAKRAFFASAIARGALVEAVTMVSISLDLVRSVVETCGFRPTKAGLARLYARVMASALIAGGVEDMDLDQMFSEAMGSGMGAKASGMLLGSTTDGLVGAYLVFRIGAITRDYLFATERPKREELRRKSFAEAAQLMKESGFLAEVAQWVRDGAVRAAGAAASSVAGVAANVASSAAGVAAAAAGGVAGAAAGAAGAAGNAMGATANGIVDFAARAVGGVAGVASGIAHGVTGGAHASPGRHARPHSGLGGLFSPRAGKDRRLDDGNGNGEGGK